MAAGDGCLAVSCLRQRAVVPVALFVGGVTCIAASVLSGEADVSLFLVFPVFSGSSGLFLLGIALIVFSFLAGFMFLMMGQAALAAQDAYVPESGRVGERAKADTKYGGVVLLGPVPIAFGSDKVMALTMLVIGIVFALVALLLLAFLALG